MQEQYGDALGGNKAAHLKGEHGGLLDSKKNLTTINYIPRNGKKQDFKPFTQEDVYRIGLSLPKAKRHNRFVRASCPAPGHFDKNPSFEIGLSPDGGLSLRCWSRGCSNQMLWDALVALRLIDTGRTNTSTSISPSTQDAHQRAQQQQAEYEAYKQQQQEEAAVKDETINSILDRLQSPYGSPVIPYLASRCLPVLPVPLDIGYLPADGSSKWPRMAVLIRNVKCEVRGIQATAITHNGEKAPIGTVRRSYGHIKGHFAALGDVFESPELAICEGTETAMAFQVLHGIPALASLSSGNMSEVILPPQVKRVWLGGDHDAAGVQAVLRAEAHYKAQGFLEVKIRIPRQQGYDFNDVLMNKSKSNIGN